MSELSCNFATTLVGILSCIESNMWCMENHLGSIENKL